MFEKRNAKALEGGEAQVDADEMDVGKHTSLQAICGL
jgi:hypothetical protein